MPRSHYATSSGSDADRHPDFFGKRVTVQELALQQGIAPARNLADFRGEFWPDGETVDDFMAAVRQWRHEGG